MSRKHIATGKRNLSLILTLALLVSALTGCAGQGTLFGYSPEQNDAKTDASFAFTERDLYFIDCMLMDAELEPKVFFNRDSISIPLQVGNGFVVYDLDSVNSKNHKLDLCVFPIFSDGVIVAIMLGSHYNGNLTFQFGKDYADELQVFMERNGNESVALVRTDSALFAASEKEVVPIEWDPCRIQKPRELPPSDIPSFVEFTALSEGPYKRFEVPGCGYATFDGEPFVLENPSRVLPTSSNLNVPVVLQNGLPICWAASTACVSNYLKYTSYTAESLYNAAIAWGLYSPNLGPGGTETGAYAFRVATIMCEMLGIQAVAYHVDQNHTILPRTILQSIVDGKPVYCDMASISSGHAVVSCGYDSLSGNSCRIRYMDPNETSIKSVQVSNIDDRQTYYCYVNSIKYTLCGYVLPQ